MIDGAVLTLGCTVAIIAIAIAYLIMGLHILIQKIIDFILSLWKKS